MSFQEYASQSNHKFLKIPSFSPLEKGRTLLTSLWSSEMEGQFCSVSSPFAKGLRLVAYPPACKPYGLEAASERGQRPARHRPPEADSGEAGGGISVWERLSEAADIASIRMTKKRLAVSLWYNHLEEMEGKRR